MQRRVIQRRVVVFLLLLLAGGAIVNVAVAWACAVWVGFDPLSYFDCPKGGVLEAEHNYQHWLVYKYENAAACRIASQWADQDLSISLNGGWPDQRPEGIIPEWAWFAQPQSASVSRGLSHYRWIEARGWPMLALWAGISCDTTDHANTQAVQTYWGIPLDLPNLGVMRSIGSGQRFIPLRPIWPGFAVNTIFYAAILWGGWVVFFVPGKLKRALRRRRGLCPACAYPVGTSPVCTECGAAVKAVGTTDATPEGE